MSLTIDISNDLEHWLEDQAKRLGTSPERLAARTVEERWMPASRVLAFPPRESQLLLEIQNAFPAEESAEFHELCRQSDAGTLSDSDRPRYRELIYRREEQNASRLKALGELADLRGMSLDELMDSLQLREEGLRHVLKAPVAGGSEAAQPTAHDLMKTYCGMIGSGVEDLATNPRHMKGFGNASVGHR